MLLLGGCAERDSAPAPVLLSGLVENPGAGVVNVGPGDTLYAIAKRYRLPMTDIIEFNRLQPPFELEIGARIQLPPPREYRVKPGDSLYTVSRAFAVDLRQLATLNDLREPYDLNPNQTLRLPSPSSTTEIARGGLLPRAEAVTSTVLSAPIAREPDRTVFRDLGRPAPVPDRKPGAVVPSDLAGVSPVRQPPTADLLLPGLKPITAPPIPPVVSAAVIPSPVPPAIGLGNSDPAPAVQAPPPRRIEPAPQPQQTLRNQAPPPRTGTFSWPLLGRLVSGYGPKAGGLHNDGINIAAPKGSPVRAAERGIVAYAGNELRGFGNLLLIRHSDGWMTAYAHLDRLLIGRGEVVDAGATIGTVGSTGSVDSPQLHFEIRRGSRALDPMLYLPRQTSSLN